MPHLYSFIPSWTLRLFPSLGYWKYTAVNMGCIYLFELVFCFLVIDTNRNGIARSYGSSIFNFLRNPHTLSIVAAPIYIPTNNVWGFPFLHIWRHLSLLVFLIIAILTSVRRYFIVVFICFSLMISDVEHLFACLLAICVSTLIKFLFISSTHFLNWVAWLFLMLRCMSYLY